MPAYRFESVDSAGVPIHGILDAVSESHLREMLERRGQKLVSAQPQNVLGTETDVARRIPRMVQLRVGESLRAAFLTQIPAQDALRAAAREPLWHPLAGLFPWILAISVFLMFVTGLYAYIAASLTVPFILAALMTVVVIPVAWGLTIHATQTRPRRLLSKLADRLDAGDSDMATLSGIVTGPMRSIARSRLPDRAKALAMSELASRPSVSTWGRHRFAFAIFGSFGMVFGAGMAIYGFLVIPMPHMREIFENFDLDLPVMTQSVMQLSQSFQMAGLTGFLAICFVGVACFVLLYALIYRGWGADGLQRVPVLGTGLKWVNLARTARLLAVLIRNDCPSAESLRIATGQVQSGSKSKNGDQPEEFSAQDWIDGAGAAFDGLPVSLLLSTGTSAEHSQRRAVAASTFDGLAAMFEQSVSGYGALVTALVQVCVLLCISVVLGTMILASFLPLIQLLNDLS